MIENVKIKVLYGKNDFKREVSEMASAFFDSFEIEFQRFATENIDGLKTVYQAQVQYEAQVQHEAQVQYEVQVKYEVQVQGTEDIFLKVLEGELESEVYLANKQIKKKIYELFSKITGKKLPWGTMTGIRPVKLYRRLFDQNPMNVKEKLKEDYLVSEEKIAVMEGIFNCENRYLTDEGAKEFSIYVGIPFCPSKCAYCSFSSVKGRADRTDIEAYLKNLFLEIKEVGEALKGRKVQSIYIGGGTPGVLEPEEIKELIGILQEFFPGATEITFEGGRPDVLSPEKLAAALAAGATRICVNPQTMNDKVLAELGRNHSAADVERVNYEARDVGFDNINMDLILGLPGETWQSFMASLEAVIKLGPESITIHALALKKASEFMASGLKHLEAERPDISELIREKLLEEGYEAYYLYRQKNTFMNLENVGYAKKGFESIFNLNSMADKQTCIAFGADSVSKFINEDRTKRIHNPKNPNDYNNKISELIEKKLALL